jgi:AraC-like DNA-binding protein
VTDSKETRREAWARSQLIPYAAVTLGESGHDVAPILRRFGLPWPLDAAEIELPMTQHHALLDELAVLSKDPAFALHLGQRRRHGSHGLLEYFWRTADNVEKAMLELVARGPLLDENSEFVFKRVAGGGLFGLRVRAHRYGLGRHSNEFLVSAGIAEIEKLTGKPANVRRVLFEHAARTPGVDYEKELSCARVEFDVGLTGFELDDETLARGMSSADPALLATLRRHVKGQGAAARPLGIAERPTVSEEVSRITEALRSQIGGSLPSLTQLAESVGLSARSLQRRLAEEGLTLRALAERVRMQEAERRLRETREDISTIASTLGFSSASNFARAFRRWAGTTPQAFRTEKKQS